MVAREYPRIDLGSEEINEMSRNFWNSAILRAAIKLELFSLVNRSPLTADEIAREVEGNPRFVQAFLDACVALELLDKRGARYTNSRKVSKFLSKGKESYVGDLVLHITNHWNSWGQLDELIREGKTAPPFETGYVDTDTYWMDYMLGQHNRAAAGQAYYLVEEIDLTGRRRMLDMGGGAASYSIALCGANPQLHAVVVDQKEPLEIARPLVEDHDLQDRIELKQADIFEDDLGSGYDVVLISGVVLISPEKACRQLFRRAFDILEPGGLAVVQDFMRVDDSPSRAFMDTLMDLYVLIAFEPGAGDRHGEEVASWLEDAGFRNTRMIALPTHLELVTAEKPR